MHKLETHALVFNNIIIKVLCTIILVKLLKSRGLRFFSKNKDILALLEKRAKKRGTCSIFML